MSHRPGDIILDRYLPDADAETREAAREALRAFARWIVRSAKAAQDEEADSPEERRRRTIPGPQV